MNEKEKQEIIDDIFVRETIVEILPSEEDFKNKLLKDKMRFYIGFDATAPFLHLSHAKNFMLLEKIRKIGHEVIILFGDFTARIGDPTGEDSARKQLTREEVLENVKTWKKLIGPLMNFSDKNNPPKIMYNNDWLSKLSFEDIIKLSSNFTVQQMLERDMFEKRIKEEKPIYLHEFFYPLMQGYDSVAMEVDVELCGTDQIFNALAGRTLLKRIKNKEKFVVAVTLMENPKTGELMSKSKGVGVFIDSNFIDLFGQVMSQPDEMMEILFKNNTFLKIPEIEEILKEEQRDSKMRLAFEIVKIYHGKEKAKEAQEEFVNVFSKKGKPENIPEIKLSENKSLIDTLADNEIESSKSRVRILLRDGAIKINEEKVFEDISLQGGEIVKVGKRKWVKIK